MVFTLTKLGRILVSLKELTKSDFSSLTFKAERIQQQLKILQSTFSTLKNKVRSVFDYIKLNVLDNSESYVLQQINKLRTCIKSHAFVIAFF